jgi:hypothetical protein
MIELTDMNVSNRTGGGDVAAASVGGGVDVSLVLMSSSQNRVRTGHTCIPYIVKSKRGSTEKQVMQSRSKGASVWISG